MGEDPMGTGYGGSSIREPGLSDEQWAAILADRAAPLLPRGPVDMAVVMRRGRRLRVVRASVPPALAAAVLATGLVVVPGWLDTSPPSVPPAAPDSSPTGPGLEEEAEGDVVVRERSADGQGETVLVDVDELRRREAQMAAEAALAEAERARRAELEGRDPAHDEVDGDVTTDYAEWIASAYGLEERPAVEPVQLVGHGEWSDVMVRCLTEAGWQVQRQRGGFGVEAGEGTGDQLGGDLYTCARQFPVGPE